MNESYYIKKLSGISAVIYREYSRQIRLHGIAVATSALQLQLVDRKLSDILLSIYTTYGLKGARKSHRELLEAIGQKELGARDRFWLENVLSYLRFGLLRFIARIRVTIHKDVLKIIADGIAAGKGSEEIARALETSQVPVIRARVIVRTESVRALNVGHTIAAENFPYECTKIWKSARDERTRRSHRLMHNKEISENAIFEVPRYRRKILIGYDKMRFPCDVSGSAENVCNCRCRVVYKPLLDNDNNPVLRKRPVLNLA